MPLLLDLGRDLVPGQPAQVKHTVALPSGAKPPPGYVLAGARRDRLLGDLDVYVRSAPVPTIAQKGN